MQVRMKGEEGSMGKEREKESERGRQGEKQLASPPSERQKVPDLLTVPGKSFQIEDSYWPFQSENSLWLHRQRFPTGVRC